MTASPINRIPVDCPRCRKPLYPISTLRPRPRATVGGRLLVLAGGVVATAVLIGGGVYVHNVVAGTDYFVFSRLAGLTVVVPAVLAGLPFAWAGHRLGRVVRLRCRACGWHEAFRQR